MTAPFDDDADGEPPIPARRVRQLGYRPPPQIPPELLGRPDLVLRRLDLNEAPSPPSPRVVAAIQAAASELNRYPEHNPDALARALAERAGLPADRVIFGNGSDELVLAAGQVALSAGDEALLPVPSFPPYGKAVALQDAVATGVPTRADGVMDVAATIAAATGPRCRLVFAATPNNPTGGMLSGEEVERLVLGVPDTALLMLDEAYFEFGRHAGGPDILPIMARRRGPWIVTRTLSKAYSLAGLRVGYGYAGTASLAEAFRKVRTAFNLNRLAQAAALAALDDEAYMQATLDANARERRRLSDGLRALGFDPFPSAANFVAARTSPFPGGALAEALRRRGILVQALAWPGVPDALRITVGTAEDTDAVLEGLRDAVREGRQV